MKSGKLTIYIRWGALLLILLFSEIKAQKFYLADSVKLQTNLEVGYFKQIHSGDFVAYYWNSATSYGNDSITFFTYDFNSEIIWYKIPSPFENTDYSSCSSMALKGDKLLILGPYYFYIFIKEDNNYHLIKRVKLKNQGNIDKIYFLDSNDILLAGTYDYAEPKTPWSNYNFYWYNTHKNKYVYHNSLDVGRGINLCYYPLQTISYNSEYLAISYITKPKILLYSKNHTFIREINLSSFSFNTDSVIAKYLTDDLLLQYRFSPKNKIEIINKHKLYKYPSMKRICFINSDTLMCVVNTSFESFNDSRKVYLYSIKLDSVVKAFFVSKNDKNIPRTFFLTSGLIQFNANIISYVKEVYDAKIEGVAHELLLYKYEGGFSVGNELNTSSIERIDTLGKKKVTILAMTMQNISNFSYDYKGNRPSRTILNNYQSVIYIDQYFCTSCYQGYKNKKVLILIENEGAMSVEQRFIKQEYYKLLFHSSLVLFLKDGFHFNKKLLNRVVQIKENKDNP